MKDNITIAIDGPASSGKSTVAKLVAKERNFIYIDTGAMYRALTLKASQTGVHYGDDLGLYNLLMETEIDFVKEGNDQGVLLDGRDVTNKIRETAVSNNVSEVSSHRNVRIEMVSRQQKMAERKNVVMDGRDIGTVVLKDATLKIFLQASAHERARRRFEENKQRGIDSDFETILSEIQLRDKYDSTRKESPLEKAEDAIVIDSTELSIDQVKQRILDYLDKKLN